ncbi:MAG: YeaH/YhbH family protein [Gammaproteobacteria bacterium]|nr:YeaH/YhbH family protein [Gammaproteobacteria bacterium]
MTRLIDRRINGKNKSAVNRQRFLKRYKEQIKRSVADAISTRSITDIESGESISIPAKDISEPFIHHGSGGKNDIVHPGNKEFVAGDRMKRPQKQGGANGKGDASDQGEGEDDFSFEISKEEFMEFFFEDMELPNLIKTKIATVYDSKKARAGFKSSGIPANINVTRSMRNAYGRRIALKSPYKKELKEQEQELALLQQDEKSDGAKIKAITERIELLKRKIKNIPYIDEFDLRFNNHVDTPKPVTQAVMFCIMDISGSMDQQKKEITKRFFILLYLFLTRNYEKIELVFISHHTTAKEVSEEEFFYSRETGGTIVSSALLLMHQIAEERYNTSDWNIYVAQASDGDNWHDDSGNCKDILIQKIMPMVQYYSYVEVKPLGHQSLWEEYKLVEQACKHFTMQQLDDISDIFPVLHELFKKQEDISNIS